MWVSGTQTPSPVFYFSTLVFDWAQIILFLEMLKFLGKKKYFLKEFFFGRKMEKYF
jgi:hypothetical protein